ncbi:hypothetical protein AB0H09_25165 [Streptomyces lydicus]
MKKGFSFGDTRNVPELNLALVPYGTRAPRRAP